MALRITYWTASKFNPNVPGSVISSESLAISGTSGQSGATPANAVFVSIRSTEAGDVNFAYDGTNPTALATGTSAGIASGERLWMDAIPTFKIAGITAS